MKRVLVFIVIWSFLVVTGSIIAANSQTRHRGGMKGAAQANIAVVLNR